MGFEHGDKAFGIIFFLEFHTAEKVVCKEGVACVGTSCEPVGGHLHDRIACCEAAVGLVDGLCEQDFVEHTVSGAAENG
ncbi:hypothetical protein [uncultured Duncaniella sp.]|uniref:hypothetical protein n=1 Tax=uncultured Duncaniella sp. TaxID=2768039 RepID=UPI0025A940C4|nr:hypothetical protein [uncultured Duncaniella sp.]